MESNLVAIPECVKYVDAAVGNNTIKFCFLSDAPFLVKLISRGGYCACGNTVYVPAEHFTLASSKNESDRIVATAKLLPWVMAIRDLQVPNVFCLWSFLRNYKQLSKYFIYEYGFLSVSDSAYADLIFAGFVTTRRTFWGRRIPPEIIVDYIREQMLKKEPTN